MHTLRNRLLASHLLPSLLLFPLVAFLVIRLVETQLFWPMLTRELTDQVIVLREIAHHSTDLWQDASVAHDFVKHFHPDPEDQLLLLTPDGRVWAANDPIYTPLVGQRLDLADLATAQGDEVQTRRRYSPEQAAQVIDVWIPVRDAQQQTLGFVYMTYQLANVFDYLRRFQIFVLLITAGALILRVVVGLISFGSLERPLTDLANALEQLMEGKTVTLPERGITELHRLARTFNGLTERLRLLEASRQHLLANLIHEIRRPLGALNSATHALLHGASDDPPLRTELLTGINGELRRLHRLTDTLALLYTQSIGVLELNLRSTDLAEWLPPVLAPWREAAHQKGIAWQTPDLSSLPSLVIDPDRLAQALGNLLSNAVKFTPADGLITLTSGQDDTHWWLRISDSGPGIAMAEQGRIFAPFYRSYTNQPFPQGMGLGLSIAQDITTAHNGQLTVESTPGKGSHFTLWLPLTSLQVSA